MEQFTMPVPATVLAFPEQHQPPQLQAFWASQMAEIEQLDEIKNHNLPLARIKKIMKADYDVKMIAGEVPVVFARACEMFILEMTMRAWSNTAGNKRRTLQKCDVAAAIAQADIYDFLVDIVPRDEITPTAETMVPYYYVPAQVQDAAAGTAPMMMMEEPVDHHAWEQQQNGGLELGNGSKSNG